MRRVIFLVFSLFVGACSGQEFRSVEAATEQMSDAGQDSALLSDSVEPEKQKDSALVFGDSALVLGDSGSELDAACSSECSVGTACQNSFSCASGFCQAGQCAYGASCKEILLNEGASPSGTYHLQSAGVEWDTYCEMRDDGGGWSLILKQDGSASTLAYESELWTNSSVLNPQSADMKQVEAKLAGYGVLGFTQFRLGFAELSPASPAARFLVISTANDSFLKAITTLDNEPFKAPRGTSDWLGLNPSFELAGLCNAQGINIRHLARVGIVAGSVYSCELSAWITSRIGLGGSGETTAGNTCSAGCKTTNLHLAKFGYLMVR